MDAALPETLAEEATRLDAAAAMSLIAEDKLLPALSDAVPADTDRGDVKRLYQAGIFTGVDEAGNFDGKAPLTRAQFAVILARLLSPELRVTAQSQST